MTPHLSAHFSQMHRSLVHAELKHYGVLNILPPPSYGTTSLPFNITRIGTPGRPTAVSLLPTPANNGSSKTSNTANTLQGEHSPSQMHLASGRYSYTSIPQAPLSTAPSTTQTIWATAFLPQSLFWTTLGICPLKTSWTTSTLQSAPPTSGPDTMRPINSIEKPAHCARTHSAVNGLSSIKTKTTSSNDSSPH